MIEPTVLEGGAVHGVFAAHLISKSGCEQFAFDSLNDIKIRHTGFHHDHVGTFLQVECAFMQRLVRIGWVHLIGGFVAFP